MTGAATANSKDPVRVTPEQNTAMEYQSLRSVKKCPALYKWKATESRREKTWLSETHMIVHVHLIYIDNCPLLGPFSFKSGEVIDKNFHARRGTWSDRLNQARVRRSAAKAARSTHQQCYIPHFTLLRLYKMQMVTWYILGGGDLVVIEVVCYWLFEVGSHISCHH